jgi:peptidoglycan-associated lipoprotein
MKFAILGIGIAGIVLSVGCHKAVPVAAKAVAPVAAPAEASPAPAPAKAAIRPAPSETIPPTPQQRSTQLTPAERATLNERLARLADALFDYDKSVIRTDATAVLRDDVAVIRDILANYPVQKLVIEGHTDERGSEEYNMALGDRRAQAAEGFLSSMGIPQTQLTVISYGKDKPRCTEQTEQCWQENRRAHIAAAP